MSTITPMTAEQFRAENETHLRLFPMGAANRILAALEEREALLGEREQTLSWNKIATKTINDGTEEICGLRRRVAELETLLAMAQVNYSADTRDAEVGALVAKIQRHPKSVAPVVHDGYGLDVFTGALSADGFRSILSHLDSLLPKEPEVAYQSARDGLEAEHRATLDDMLQQATLRMSKALAGLAKLEFDQRLRAQG